MYPIPYKFIVLLRKSRRGRDEIKLELFCILTFNLYDTHAEPDSGKFALIEARPYAEGSSRDHFSCMELLYARYASNLCVSISVIEIRTRLNVLGKFLRYSGG